MKLVLYTLAAFLLSILGVIGLLLPIVPGWLFFGLAVVCVAQVSPRFRRKLHNNPRMRRFTHRLNQAKALAPVARIKLSFWALVEAIGPQRTP